MDQNQQIATSEKPILSVLLNSPTTFYNNLSPSLTITQAIASKTPPLGILKSIVNNGDVMVKALIVHAISDLNKFLNFQNIMTIPQIGETADMIISDFNALKIEDVRACFNNGKKGHYGQLYGRIDGQIIMLWLSQYSTDRTNEFLRIKDHNEKEALKKKIDPAEINPEGQRKVIELLKSVIKPVDEKKAEKPVREKSIYEKSIQRFYRQFTKICLYGKGRALDEAYRFIFMYGREMNATEYVEFKIGQQERIMKDKAVKAWIENRNNYKPLKQ